MIEERLGIPVIHECGGVGFALKREELSRSRDLRANGSPRIVTLRDIQADVILADAPEPARAISALVALRLLDGRSDIEGTAQLAGMSVQSLQRRLRQKGYTYREIVEAARRSRAVSLLRETELPVVDIALSLGYEDHANFTRAFNRWSGCSPSEFRRVKLLGAAENRRHPS